jgi:hypothetical protein
MINWFALAAGVLYVCAGIKSIAEHHYAFAGMWLFYAMANVCIVIAEYNR